MLKLINGSETYRHYCDNKNMTEKPHVYLHDVKSYMFVEIDGKHTEFWIKYCPWCGVEIEKENRS